MLKRILSLFAPSKATASKVLEPPPHPLEAVTQAKLFTQECAYLYANDGAWRDEFGENLERLNPAQFEQLVRAWMASNCLAFGGPYRLHIENGICLLHAGNDQQVQRMWAGTRGIERKLLRLARGLIAPEHLMRPLAIYQCQAEQHYFDYIAPFYPPEQPVAGMSSGMWINGVIPHIVLNAHDDIADNIQVLAHELVHASLRHLALPTWLDEGLATNFEAAITEKDADRQTLHTQADMHKFWRGDAAPFAGFISGANFSATDQTMLMSYRLARELVLALGKDWPHFCQFLQDADYQDSGERALQKHYGVGLMDLLAVRD
jgi:hypothetical protein